MVEHGPTWRVKGRAMARPGPMGATPLLEVLPHNALDKSTYLLIYLLLGN